jgi:hypothetical protein
VGGEGPCGGPGATGGRTGGGGLVGTGGGAVGDGMTATECGRALGWSWKGWSERGDREVLVYGAGSEYLSE